MSKLCKNLCKICINCTAHGTPKNYNTEYFLEHPSPPFAMPHSMNPFLECSNEFYGAAIDIGTTNIAMHLYKFPEGEYIGTARARNKQGIYGADIMSRIHYALEKPAALTTAINEQLAEMVAGFNVKCDAAVIVGNTAILYFYAGLSTNNFAAAPFAITNFLGNFTNNNLGYAYLPNCISAFVGADVLSAVLAAGMGKSNKIELLVDIGTNGEIILFYNGKFHSTSTAAGPAFEGSGIRGSELIDAIAARLNSEEIDEAGNMDDNIIIDGITFNQDNMRQFQLAKSAVRAGMDSLIAHCGITYTEVDTLYITGAFGNGLNIPSAIRIGLLPKELRERVIFIGDGASAGATMMLFDKVNIERMKEIARATTSVDLLASGVFAQKYMENIGF